MKPKPSRLDSVRIRNFKAIQDSDSVKLTPLTVLIGNNGSGKSSLVEALETVQTMVAGDLDRAMQLWRGIEHIRYKGQKLKFRPDDSGELRAQTALEFHFRGRLDGQKFAASSAVNERGGANEIFFERESVEIGNTRHERNGDDFQTIIEGTKQRTVRTHPRAQSLLGPELGDYIRR